MFAAAIVVDPALASSVPVELYIPQSTLFVAAVPSKKHPVARTGTGTVIWVIKVVLLVCAAALVLDTGQASGRLAGVCWSTVDIHALEPFETSPSFCPCALSMKVPVDPSIVSDPAQLMMMGDEAESTL